MSDEFYRSFEDKHRGSRKLIKSRLNVYLPFIKPLAEIYPNGPVLDLGCGRGEWLELLSEQTNFDASGVDVDSAMLAVCEQHALQCKLQDAITCLRSMEDDSHIIISGFHLVEHLHFSQLQELVQQAHRVLKPAGLIILETPNPENIVVANSGFYMDPTHQRPLPPNLLAFVTEYYNFKRTKIVRLQESSALMTNENPTMLDVLNGVSPDYAIIAQKDGPKGSLSKLNGSFAKEYGLTLEMLATRYDHARGITIAQAGAKVRVATDEQYQLKSSTLWRDTAPLRNIMYALKKYFKSRLSR